MRQIKAKGHFRKHSWLTLDELRGLSARQIADALCLDDDKKAECVCECSVLPGMLYIPAGGPLTCKGKTQVQLRQRLPVRACNCKCKINGKWFWLAGVVAVAGGAWYLHKRANRN